MGDNELLIKINGDAKDFKAALTEAQSETEALDAQLTTLAKVSGAAFAGFTAEIGFSVHAFAEAQAASNQLVNSLQNQGIATESLIAKYKGFAEAIQDKTGVDDDAIISSQAVLQSYLGETEITKELTQAVVDLSVRKKIDLNSAAELVGKSIGTTTNVLGRMGLEMDATASTTQKLATVTDFLNDKFGGTAEAANKGLGGIKGLSTAFGNFQEGIGQRFAPIFEFAIAKLTEFFSVISKNKAILDFVVAVLSAGTVVSGLVLGLAIAAKGFLLFKAAMQAAGLAANITKLSVQGLIGATGLGLLVIVITEVALNWNTIWPRMLKVFESFVNNISKLATGLGEILLGVFTFDTDAITKGLADVKAAFSKGVADASAEIKPVELPGIEAGNKKPIRGISGALATPTETPPPEESDTEDPATEIKAEQDLFERNVGLASKVFGGIAKGGEGAAEAVASAVGLVADTMLPGIGSAVTQIISFLAQGPEKVRETIKSFFAALPGIIENIVLAIPAVIEALVIAIPEVFTAILDLIPGLIAAIVDTLFGLLNDEKFINSLVFAGLKFQLEMIKLTPMIAIALIESLSKQSPFLIQTIQLELIKAFPGIIAAFAVEFLKIPEQFGRALLALIPGGGGGGGGGARKIFGFAGGGKIVGAQAGALLTGGVAGRDSIPVLGQEGELIAPAKNFEEVVGAVQSVRQSKDAEILAALQSIDAKIKGGNTYIIQGDVMADQSFVQALMTKIKDQIEFNNATLTPATGV